MGRRKGWYAGPRGFEEWKRTPAISPDFSSVGSSDTLDYLNGGIGVRKSSSSHKTYDLSWNLLPRDDARAITDMAQGVWDGDEEVTLIYHLDPMAMNKNLFNTAWGAPSQGAHDGMPLFIGQDPSLTPTPANAFRYPARSAVYLADGTSEVFYCPLPQGFSAWLGFHGSVTGDAGVMVTPFNGASAGAPVMLTPLGVDTSTLVDTEFPAASGITGIEVSLVATGFLRNLSTNPSFEADLTGVRAVSNGGTAAVTRPGGTAKFGNFVARATFGGASAQFGSGLSTDIDVEAGKTMSFSLFGRTSVATRVRPLVSFLNAAGGAVGIVTYGTEVVTAANPAWSTVTTPMKLENVLVPAGAITARVSFQTVSGTSYAVIPVSGWMEIDGIQANEGATVQAYADGNTSGWEWTAGVGGSISRERPDTITLSGLILQVLPTGMAPRPGTFISGQGNAGCQFVEEPRQSPYSAVLGEDGYVAISAKLVETQPWL